MNTIKLIGMNGDIVVAKAVVKGYELNNVGLPTSFFFASGMSWPISPNEENLQELESIGLTK